MILPSYRGSSRDLHRVGKARVGLMWVAGVDDGEQPVASAVLCLSAVLDSRTHQTDGIGLLREGNRPRDSGRLAVGG